MYYGGTLVASEQMTIGGLTSFLLYAGYTAISIGGLSNFYSELNKGIGSAARVWEIFDRKPSIPIEGGIRPDRKPFGDITFENISFNYDSRPDAPVLKDLNLKLKSGTITVIFLSLLIIKIKFIK